MRAIIVAAFASALLVPASPAPAGEGPIVLALNPQPEPPGRAKIKRIYIKQPDSRRNKTIKQPTNQVAPKTTY
jgi:hypothetical protein